MKSFDCGVTVEEFGLLLQNISKHTRSGRESNRNRGVCATYDATNLFMLLLYLHTPASLSIL